MGIVIKELVNFNLSDGDHYRIEFTIDGRIHIHINSLQINLSLREYYELGKNISDAHKKLLKIKKEYE